MTNPEFCPYCGTMELMTTAEDDRICLECGAWATETMTCWEWKETIPEVQVSIDLALSKIFAGG